MSEDEQRLFANAVRTAAFNGLIDERVSEQMAHIIADHVAAEFVEQSAFLVTQRRANGD